VLRAIGKRPFKVQLMGALAMIRGAVAEMATGEGKTLTAAMAASVWSWEGRLCNARDDAAGADRRLSPQRRLCHQQGTRRGFPARSDPARCAGEGSAD